MITYHNNNCVRWTFELRRRYIACESSIQKYNPIPNIIINMCILYSFKNTYLLINEDDEFAGRRRRSTPCAPSDRGRRRHRVRLLYYASFSSKRENRDFALFLCQFIIL